MATLNKSIIRSAIDEGLIQKAQLNSNCQVLHKTVLTSRRIYRVIKESGADGLNLKQLMLRLKLNETTLRDILKVFEEKNITRQEKDYDRSWIYRVK